MYQNGGKHSQIHPFLENKKSNKRGPSKELPMKGDYCAKHGWEDIIFPLKSQSHMPKCERYKMYICQPPEILRIPIILPVNGHMCLLQALIERLLCSSPSVASCD